MMCRPGDHRGAPLPGPCGQEELSGVLQKSRRPTGEKTRGDWEYTGDLMYQDENGFIYFVGRSTDSMRRRGENVSAYDVEQAILKHPRSLEAAVYAVPSEMTEDEIMASVKLVDGKKSRRQRAVGISSRTSSPSLPYPAISGSWMTSPGPRPSASRRAS